MLNTDGSIQGRFGIVTGAASGIGRAAAIYLARMGAGVALVDQDGDGLEETRKAIRRETTVSSLVFTADVTDATSVNAVVGATHAEFGAIDFLVNCAGILRRTAFLKIPAEEWRLMMKVNLDGSFFFCKAVAALMVERSQGVIVNVASVAGRSSSLLGGAHYTVAKHALVGLSRHMARELSPKGLRVNAFCPGATLTPMVTNSVAAGEIEAVAASIPRGRWATAKEQAAVIGFLVSDAAVNITGACIDSNGGVLMI